MTPVSTDLFALTPFSGEMQTCLRNCLDCTATTRICIAECVGDAAMADCVRACLDCVTTCEASVALMSMRSDLHAAMCGVCADACERCAAECAKHDADPCQACAAACRRCAESCRTMAQA